MHQRVECVGLSRSRTKGPFTRSSSPLGCRSQAAVS
jgi:hypothetical protein